MVVVAVVLLLTAVVVVLLLLLEGISMADCLSTLLAGPEVCS